MLDGNSIRRLAAGMMIVLILLFPATMQANDIDDARYRRNRHRRDVPHKPSPPPRKSRRPPIPPTSVIECYKNCVREQECREKESFEENEACCEKCKKDCAKQSGS